MLSRVSAAAVAAIFLVGCSQQHTTQANQTNPSDPGAPGSTPNGVHLAMNSGPAASSAAAAPNSPAADPPPPIAAEPVSDPVSEWTLPAGTRIRIRLEETLNTKYCHPGEHFAAVLDAPLVVGNRVVAPQGATVRGHVTASKPSGRFKGRAVLGLTLDSIQVDGYRYGIATNLTARVSGAHKKRNLAIIGGTASGGAVIGAIAGGGVGAAIGAAAGAGAGTVGAFVTGRKQVVLPVETELTFSLRGPVTVRG